MVVQTAVMKSRRIALSLGCAAGSSNKNANKVQGKMTFSHPPQSLRAPSCGLPFPAEKTGKAFPYNDQHHHKQGKWHHLSYTLAAGNSSSIRASTPAGEWHGWNYYYLPPSYQQVVPFALLVVVLVIIPKGLAGLFSRKWRAA